MTNKFVKGVIEELQPGAERLNTIGPMARPSQASLALALAAAAVAVLAGCGGGTQTVSATSEPHSTAENGGTTGATSTSPSTATPKAPATTPSTSTAAETPKTTRTAPEPAFAEAGKGSGSSSDSEGLADAEGAVHGQGYTVDDPSDYRPDQTLKVLIGTGAHSNDGYDKRAFFFVNNKYIGTDASAPSAQVSVAEQSDTEVVLAYALYKPGNPLCCPAGGVAKVRFQLNDGQLAPLDPIPPVNSTTGSSRQ